MAKGCIQPRRKRVKLEMKNFSKRTKISKGSIAWSLMKGILFIICLSLFFYQAAIFLFVYCKYPTTTKIEFTYPEKFEKPAVTFCHYNPIKISKFCATFPNLCETPANITEVCRVNPFICKDNPSNLVIPKLGDFVNDFNDEVLKSIREIYFDGNITKEFWEEWAWSIEAKNEMKPVFVHDPWMFFPCFTENLHLNTTDEPQKMYLSSNYRQREISSYKLNLQRSEEIYFGAEPVVLFSIHSPFVPVNLLFQGSPLKLGSKYSIYIKLEEEISLPFPYDTNCTDYEDLWRKGNRFEPRSQEMCQELCLHNLHEKNKDMPRRFRMLEYPLKLCFDRNQCHWSSEEKEALKSCWKGCKRNCRNLKYITTVIETSIDSSKKEFRDFESEREKIQVAIFLGDRQVVVERHVPVYDTGHLFSYIGGLMGCWLGVSIWAFAGIAENVFRRAIQWIKHIKRHFKQPYKSQHATFSIHRNNVHNIKIL